MSTPDLDNVLSGGVVQFVAVVAMIGCRTAESLTYGNKGPAGLPWAVMTIFGAVFVVRACITAITPGWLRETLAMRNPETDGELGWNLKLGKTNSPSRAPIGTAVGIMRKITPEGSTKLPKEDARDVYAFDRITSAYLDIVPSTSLSDHLKVYIMTRDLHRISKFMRDAQDQALGLVISTIKLVEVLVLWRQKAVVLSLVTAASWVFFFLGGSALLAFQVTHDFSGSEADIDILAGQLPTPPIFAGGERKLILGTPPNSRENKAWTVFWFLGALVCVSSITTLSLILGSQDRLACQTWMAFQIIWLALRSLFFHFARGTDCTVLGHRGLSVKAWKGLQEQFKERVRGLVFAFSRHQMHVHPRGFMSYQNDLQIVDKLGEVREMFHLRDDSRPTVQIKISGVLGDTLLSSVAYIFGSNNKLNVESLYDSAIIRLSLKDGSLVSIPCARVLSDEPAIRKPLFDAEKPQELEFPPRGAGNSGGSTATWYYWIPCDGNGLWLQLRHPVNNKLDGDVVAEVVTDERIWEQLRRGVLFVSLKDVKQVKEIVRNSREACQMTVEMLQ